MRFHTQTAGSTLTAQQPLNNVVRTAYQGLAAVLGGTQSLHTNSYDEALGLPTSEAAMIALRTQQVLGYESGVADVVDPLAGSYYVESLTDRIEADALALITAIDELGGAVAGIDGGFQQREIESAAYDYARAIDAGDATVVGLNRFEVQDDVEPDVTRVDEALGQAQVARLKDHRAARGAIEVEKALDAITQAAQGSQNLLYPMKDALVAGATIGEITDALVPVFGRYRPSH